MFKNYLKVLLNTLLIFACVFFHGCKDQDTVTPQENQIEANNDVLQKIKSLGFPENQIKEMPDYYLADGDVYFSKTISSNATPVKKSGHRILEKYATLTIHVDESLTDVIDENLRAGINQAIAEWNAKKDAHFHFKFTKSNAANINIIKDTDLPKDLAIASEFPSNGRTGSSIHINVSATTVVKDPTHAFTHALEHCLGLRHSSSTQNTDIKVSNSAAKTAAVPRYFWELYAIQGDALWRIDAMSGTYYKVNDGWAGTEVMGQVDGLLYMVQFGTLWQVSPSTGDWTPLTDGWEGSQYITNIEDLGKLYIMQGSTIWPVDPNTGLWDANLGTYGLPRGMVGYWDVRSESYKIGVLTRKPYSSVKSIFYNVSIADGTVTDIVQIPASGIAGWNKKFLITMLAASANTDPMIFNGKICSAFAAGGCFDDSSWPDVEAVTAIAESFYLINKGTLYRVDYFSNNRPHPITGVSAAKRLGKLNAWVDTSLIVFLENP